MNRKNIILELRTTRKLKGHRPCVVSMKQNGGKIYTGGQSDFVVSITDNYLHFQKLSFFLRKLQPEKDFKVPRNLLKSYNINILNRFLSVITFYTNERKYVQIFLNTGLADTYESEQNLSKIIEMLKTQGVKETNA